MTKPSPSATRGLRHRRAPARRRVLLFVRRRLRSTLFLLLGLTVLTALIAVASVQAPDWVPSAAFVLVLVLAGFLLRPGELAVLFLVVAGGVVYVDRVRPGVGVNKGVVVVLVAVAVVMWFVGVSRARLGLQGTLGETMLVDLRDRLRAQGELPRLPVGWRAETVLRSAYGDKFSGDFLVASRSTDGRRLEVVLVDVSGKGQAAGTRALLLSGAFGGLLGAMPSAEFLDSANQYLLRQRWEEGFATAVHLEVDLVSGDFRVCSAGHPPAAHFVNGSGRWDLLDGGSGPILGVVENAVFRGTSGHLARGDALMLYTDGVVETPDRDLDVGIDRMLGQAERLVQGGFTGGARRIVEGARAGESDDRALVLIWRE